MRRGWEAIRTFEEGGEVVDVNVLGFGTFEEIEKDLAWMLVLGVAQGKGGGCEVGELPCGGSRGSRSVSEISR